VSKLLKLKEWITVADAASSPTHYGKKLARLTFSGSLWTDT
jgi:hypothetical protein